jgi:hypothetical protein
MASTNKPLRLGTLLLYGILVTEKSDLLGRRGLARKRYAEFLAYRVFGSRLPAELVDDIVKALVDLDYAEMSRLWETWPGRRCQRAAKFQLPAVGGTEAEKAAVKELQSLGVLAISVPVSVGKSDGASTRYVHISASADRPSLAQLCPGATPPNRPALRYADGHLQVHCFPGTATTVSREHVQVCPSSKKRQVARLVQVDGIENSIRSWDQEAVERVVALLELRVVSMNGEEEGQGWTPRLRLLNIVEWT